MNRPSIFLPKTPTPVGDLGQTIPRQPTSPGRIGPIRNRERVVIRQPQTPDRRAPDPDPLPPIGTGTGTTGTEEGAKKTESPSLLVQAAVLGALLSPFWIALLLVRREENA